MPGHSAELYLDEPVAGDAGELRVALTPGLDEELHRIRGPQRWEVGLGRHGELEPAVLTRLLVLRVPRDQRRRTQEDEGLAHDEAARVLHLDSHGDGLRP